MSSNEETPDVQHVTEKQTVGDFIDNHKESAILIIGLIVLLVGALKLCYMLFQVCKDVKRSPVMRNILYFCSRTRELKSKAKEPILTEEDHACIVLHYDIHVSKAEDIYTESHENKDRQLDTVAKDISVYTMKGSEAYTEYSKGNEEDIPMLAMDNLAGVNTTPPPYSELTAKSGEG